MANNPTPDQQAELVALARQMQTYFDSLAVAGVPEQMIVSAALTEAVARVVLSTTPTKAAAWLRGHALLVEKHGDEIAQLQSDT